MPETLWTYAREKLDIVVLIFSNRKYQILRDEMANVGVRDFGPKAHSLLGFDKPSTDKAVPNSSFDTAYVVR